MYSLALLGFTAFLVSLLLTPAVRYAFGRLGLSHRPGWRKLRPDQPALRVGGVAIACAYLAAYGVLVLVGSRGGDIVWSYRASIWQLLPAATVIFAIGLYDDLIGLTQRQKVAGQIFAATLAYLAGIHVQGLGGHGLSALWSFPVTILWLLLCTNAMNLIDGVDGLAAGIGLFATITTLIAALLQNNYELALATIPLAGVLLGFLRFNFYPATIFLGNSGTYFIGFLLGCYGVLWSQKSATILGMTAPLMVLAIPLVDAALSIARRFLRRRPLFTGDHNHIYHRLLELGLTPRKVAFMLYGCCLVGAVASLAMMNQNFGGLIIVAFCAVIWLGIQKLGYIEFGVAGRMMLGGAFRRHLNAQIALQALERNLASAQTLDECWSVIQKGAKEFGFHRVRMRVGGHTYEHGYGIGLVKWWGVRVNLNDYDFIEFDRAFDMLCNSTTLTPFADMLLKVLAYKLPALLAPPAPRYQTAAEQS